MLFTKAIRLGRLPSMPGQRVPPECLAFVKGRGLLCVIYEHCRAMEEKKKANKRGFSLAGRIIKRSGSLNKLL